LETNIATPIKVVSDTFCASGGFLSNGSMVKQFFMLNFLLLNLY
jgi:hypothetical protein